MKTNKVKKRTLVPTLAIFSEEKKGTWFDCEKIAGVFHEVKNIPLTAEQKKEGYTKVYEYINTWFVLEFGSMYYLYLHKKDMVKQYGVQFADNLIAYCNGEDMVYETGDPWGEESQKILKGK